MGSIRLTYRDMRGVEDADQLPPQPALVQGAGHKRPTRVVPIHKDHKQLEPCTGCIALSAMINRAYDYSAGDTKQRYEPYDCYDLPDCDRAIFVRATPENKIKHIAWRLENDR